MALDLNSSMNVLAKMGLMGESIAAPCLVSIIFSLRPDEVVLFYHDKSLSVL